MANNSLFNGLRAQDDNRRKLSANNNPTMTSPTYEDICEEIRHDVTDEQFKQTPHVIVVLGASGDLAKKKIYPSLWKLFKDKLLPLKTEIIGFARSKMDVNGLREKAVIKVKAGEADMLNNFWAINHYVSATDYEDSSSYVKLNAKITEIGEKQQPANRMFYLALPETTFKSVTSNLNQYCRPTVPCRWFRVVIEKPFGRDSESSNELSAHLNQILAEKEIYRIDHYLGKEMVQNMLILRFANQIISPSWNRDHISSVSINMKENIGTMGRGGYFDSAGIIRDVMQNHLLQILSLVAMEKPISKDSEAIRDEKVKVLKKMRPISLDEVVLGQYQGDPQAPEGSEGRFGYLDDDTIKNKDSKTPTFALAVTYVNNERWDKVPFFIRAGKALNERKTEVRIQYKNPPGDIFDGEAVRNELVIRVQGPDPQSGSGEAIYVKMNTKHPGSTFKLDVTELDLTYSSRYQNLVLPDAYERLIFDVLTGSQMNFVRSDELEEAWRIFTPLVKDIDAGKRDPLPYTFNSRGPKQADDFMALHGYKFTGTYNWPGRGSVNGGQ